MKQKSYSGSTSKQDARKEVNRMVREVKQEIDSLSTVTTYTNTELTELFTYQLFERLGIPLDQKPSIKPSEKNGKEKGVKEDGW